MICESACWTPWRLGFIWGLNSHLLDLRLDPKFLKTSFRWQQAPVVNIRFSLESNQHKQCFSSVDAFSKLICLEITNEETKQTHRLNETCTCSFRACLQRCFLIKSGVVAKAWNPQMLLTFFNYCNIKETKPRAGAGAGIGMLWGRRDSFKLSEHKHIMEISEYLFKSKYKLPSIENYQLSDYTDLEDSLARLFQHFLSSRFPRFWDFRT